MRRLSLSLLEGNSWAPRYFDEIRKKQKKPVKLSDLSDDGKKVDLRYVRKAGRYAIDTIERDLRGKIPAPDYDDFLYNWAGTVSGWESARKDRYPIRKAVIFGYLKDTIGAQIDNSIRTNGGDVPKLIATIKKAMRGKSDEDVVIAGIKSGYLTLRPLQVRQMRTISSGDPDDLKKILKFLKAR